MKGQEASEKERVKAPDIQAQKHVLSIAESNKDQLQADFQRSKALYESGAISLQAYENAKQTYEAGQDQYQMEVSRLQGLQAQNEVGQGRKPSMMDSLFSCKRNWN